MSKRRILKPEEVYGDEMSLNMIDDKFIYYSDNTCVEISEKEIKFYKLENPYSIDIPLYKYDKILHRDKKPAIERSDKSYYDYYEDGVHLYTECFSDGQLIDRG